MAALAVLAVFAQVGIWVDGDNLGWPFGVWLVAGAVGASAFVRRVGFGGRLSRTDVGSETGCEINTSIGQTDAAIEGILARQYNRALTLLQDHGALLARISDALVRQGEMSRAELAGMLGLQVTAEPAVLSPYAVRLSAFADRQLRTGAAGPSRSGPVALEAAELL